MIDKLKKKILFSFIIGGLFYLSFTVYGNFDKVIAAFAAFNWVLFPLLLLLSLMNYLTRFLKWDYYLSILNVRLEKKDSLSIFMSGLIMSITPGKMGELLKSYLVKEINNTPVSKTFPIIFVERITDFVSLILIALLGAYIFNYGGDVVIAVGVFFLAVLFIISNKNIMLWLLRQLERNNFMHKHLESIHNAYTSSYQMLRPRPLFYMTLLSLVSWSFECLGYYLILINFNIDVSFLWAAFSYSFATIVGAITMLPGGLGVTEGSLTFLLIQNSVAKNLAVASTFIIRVVTLWFAVFVGIISVAIYQNRFGKITV